MFSADPFSDAFGSSTDDEVLLSPTLSYPGIDYSIDPSESSDSDQSITQDYRFRESVNRLEEMKKMEPVIKRNKPPPRSGQMMICGGLVYVTQTLIRANF